MTRPLAQVEFLAYMLTRGWVASAPRDVVMIMRVEETLRRFDGGAEPDDALAYGHAFEVALFGAS